MSSSHTPQIAIVTGASRGIGSAIARTLAQQRILVIGTATQSGGVEQINQDFQSLTGAVPGCCGYILDVNDKQNIQTFVDEVSQKHGGLHILVNNAGITRDMLTMRLKDDDWDAVLHTNLKAVFQLCRAAIRPMMKQRYGRIINITSVVGSIGNPGQANYAAAKAGVAGMTRSLAAELGTRQITVNCIAPGFIETDMTAALPTEQKNALLGRIPLGHLGKPSDIAHAVAFLSSPEAGYITGQELHINGGMFMA